MKKYLLIGFLLLTSACQTATPTLEPSPFPTTTLPASPTPVPVSQTPEPTPTLELSPTPLPRFFTHHFDAPLAGWVILQAGNDAVPNIATRDNSLRLQLDAPYAWVYVLYGSEDYTSVHVETEFINSASSPASIGLVCGYGEADGWLEYNVSTDGTYNVLYGKWLSPGIAEYLPVIDGSSEEIGPSGGSQLIGITCSDTTLQLYANGILIRNVDVVRFEFAEGKAGLTVSSFDNTPVVAVFNWVTVSEP